MYCQCNKVGGTYQRQEEGLDSIPLNAQAGVVEVKGSSLIPKTGSKRFAVNFKMEE